MCKVLQVSKSGFYRWWKSEPSDRARENQLLTEQIREIHRWSRQSYGSPRIYQELRAQAVFVSRPRVARLMRKAGIRSIVRKKYVATTDSRHGFKLTPNLLNRNFQVGQIGSVWVSDITYIRTAQGWLYLTVIIDLGDRKVIGWSMSKLLTANQTILKAWHMAIANRPIDKQLIFHSDRGVQYAGNEFKRLISSNKLVRQSMSRKANCWDNAVAESFFKSLKTEWTNHSRYQSFSQAEIAVFEYIEAWYNTNRRHSALGYRTPTEFEIYLQTIKAAA